MEPAARPMAEAVGQVVLAQQAMPLPIRGGAPLASERAKALRRAWADDAGYSRDKRPVWHNGRDAAKGRAGQAS